MQPGPLNAARLPPGTQAGPWRIESLPLYVWARGLNPSSRKVLGLLAGVARALEVIHAAGGVHRDVKGDNVLVRLEDGRGFLTDFGSSYYRGAATLTWQVFPPGTPNYRSPEAYQFALDIRTARVKVYAPGPADDLFALGVTAYRLVTGQYPPEPQPLEAEFHVWSPDGPGPRPARELNPRCSPELSTLISRMLSVRPEARGSARELAEALEQVARQTGPEADASLFVRKAPRPAEDTEVVSWRRLPSPVQPVETTEGASQRILPQTPQRVGATDTTGQQAPPRMPRPVDATKAGSRHVLPQTPRPVEVETVPRPIDSPAPDGLWRAWLAAGLASLVTLGAPWLLSLWGRAPATQDARDAGTVAVGDSSLTAPVDSAQAPALEPSIAMDMPSQPLPGQLRPDANGRCRYKPQVPINGGCWLKVNLDLTECKTSEYSYVYKGACYQVGQPPPRPPTSGPVESRDGG